jgi:hypothetical protein
MGRVASLIGVRSMVQPAAPDMTLFSEKPSLVRPTKT